MDLVRKVTPCQGFGIAFPRGGAPAPPRTLPWKSSPVLEIELLGVTSPRGDKSRVDVERFFLFFTHPGLQLLLFVLLGALGTPLGALGALWGVLGAL